MRRPQPNALPAEDSYNNRAEEDMQTESYTTSRHVTDASEDDKSAGGPALPPAFLSTPKRLKMGASGETSRPVDYEMVVDSTGETTSAGENSKLLPLHELLMTDEEMEVAQTLKRNRTILLSRLQETIPTGRLAMVRTFEFCHCRLLICFEFRKTKMPACFFFHRLTCLGEVWGKGMLCC